VIDLVENRIRGLPSSRSPSRLEGWKIVSWSELARDADVYEASGKPRIGLFAANNPINRKDPLGLWFSYNTGNARFWAGWQRSFNRLWNSRGPAGRRFREIWQRLNNSSQEINIGPDPSLFGDSGYSDRCLTSHNIRFSDRENTRSSVLGHEYLHTDDRITGNDRPPTGVGYRDYNDNPDPPYGRGPAYGMEIEDELQQQGITPLNEFR